MLEPLFQFGCFKAKTAIYRLIAYGNCCLGLIWPDFTTLLTAGNITWTCKAATLTPNQHRQSRSKMVYSSGSQPPGHGPGLVRETFGTQP